MKIEKVNEHQIRCTLTQEDLASRKLKLSELAYGSEKAKDLFRDMMEKANDEYGFEAENIPLMIEAIPVNAECIVLIITKVEDPEELDTRFSKFAPGLEEGSDSEDSADTDAEVTDDSDDDQDIVNISDLFKRFKDAVSGADPSRHESDVFDGMAFSFSSITELASVCKTLVRYYDTESSLYRNNSTGSYLLAIKRGSMEVTDFVQTCNMLAEYGDQLRGKAISESYIKEHFEPICIGDAVAKLAEIG